MKNFVGKPVFIFAGKVCLTSFVLLFFSFVFAAEAFAAFTEVEPNNSIATANPLPSIQGAEVQAGITPVGDQDFFSFQANAGDRIWAYVVTNTGTPSTDSVLTLFDSAGNVVQLDDDNGFQSTLSSAIAGAFIPSSGTYIFQVRQFGGTTVMNPYTLYIDRTSSAVVPEIESNNTLATANSYIYGTVKAGSIPDAADEDYYTFTVAQNEKIIIQVDGDPDRNGTNLSRINQFNPNFDLLDNTGSVIQSVDSDSQGGNGGLLSESFLFINTTASTTFAIRVKADPSTPAEDDTGIYNLHIYRISAAPTAATVSVAGRVTTASGRGIRNVQISLTDTDGNERIAQTTAFGHYRFDGVTAGETVTLSVKARKFKFVQSSIVRTTNESISDADFISEE